MPPTTSNALNLILTSMRTNHYLHLVVVVVAAVAVAVEVEVQNLDLSKFNPMIQYNLHAKIYLKPEEEVGVEV